MEENLQLRFDSCIPSVHKNHIINLTDSSTQETGYAGYDHGRLSVSVQHIPSDSSRIHEKILEIVEYFDRFCQVHNIVYYLMGGSR